MSDGSFAIDLIHALGKVEREIPLPTLEEYPQGYRFSETGNVGDIRGAQRWCGLNSEWLPATVQPCPQCTDLYAVPLPTPEQDSNLEKQAEYIECEVVSAGSGEYTTLRLSKPHPLPYGTKLRVEVRKVEK